MVRRALLLACLGILAAPLPALFSGADFLRAEIPARPASLAGAFGAFDDDVNAFLWNPAALGAVRQPLVGATHFSSIIDTSFNLATFVQPLTVWKAPAGLGLGIQHSSTGDFDQIDLAGNNLGAVENYDLLLLAGAGLRLNPKLTTGLNAKLFNSRLAEYRARGFAVDLGGQAQVHRRVMLGVALLDVGGQEAFDQVADPLPTLFRLAGRFVLLEDDEASIQVASQLDRPWSTNGGITLGLGAEYWYHRVVVFRAGWRLGGELGPLSLGAGFKWQGFNLDYAFNSLEGLGMMHRFSLAAELGTLFKRLGWTVEPISGQRPERGPQRFNAPVEAR
jgi:hypothetical protein